ncbi:AraC family transcriptional regulator [Ramlibacter sp.]|uniref:AraC family transcriptional regulator n=1 Tax=Ramlibacter sp. TaxID=1917967 RepID=UPI0017CCE195|nr:AraC family transcriptional regulator [Ramlibacter sp.]MBA2674831.1 AraC family transcriptional regulator [Ramlibacter sp.]
MPVPAPSLDPLDRVLHHLRMSGTFYCAAHYASPWGVALPELRGEGRLHLVTEGRAVVYGPHVGSVELGPGDFVLLPRGVAHNVADRVGSPLLPYLDIVPQLLSQRYAQFRHGEGPGTRLVCVSVRFDDAASMRLLALLPALIHVRADTQEGRAMEQVVRMLADEARHPRAGGEAVLTRLADILVVQAMRWWLANAGEAQFGWLGALRDPQVGRVIALIHRRPEHPWTLASLAGEAALSRSALAERFKALVGQPVMRYLASWRMHLALASLQQGRADVGELAERVGYQSESAFNRAFKRHLGRTPGAVRPPRAGIGR